jgi:hypothetical protein
MSTCVFASVWQPALVATGQVCAASCIRGLAQPSSIIIDMMMIRREVRAGS